MADRRTPLRLTPLRRRILAALEQRGELDIQEIGHEFSSNPRGLKSVFNHPAAATRFGGGLVKPLRDAGLVEDGVQRFGWRRKVCITPAGRERLRQEPPHG